MIVNFITSNKEAIISDSDDGEINGFNEGLSDAI
jgi:hypothetical protein